MKKLVSIKVKLIVSILLLVIVAALSSVTIGLNQSFDLTKDINKTQFEDKVTGATNMLELYLTEQFGTLGINTAGKLVDVNGSPIEGKYEYIDKLSESMGVVATIFVKQGESYIRTLTTIVDDKGERVVGTELDPQGAAYKEISAGNAYHGEADILGNRYITKYVPIFDKTNQIIGIYFVGVPSTEVNQALDKGMTSTIRSVALLTILVLLVAGIVSLLIAASIANPVKRITRAAQRIAEGDLNVELTAKSRDEIGQLAEAFKQTIGQLTNYQSYIDEISDTLHSVANGNLIIQLHMDYTGQFGKLKESITDLATRLNQTILTIMSSSEQVASGSDLLSGSSIALSQGATEQASAVQQLTASLEEIASQTTLNTENARKANELAMDAENQAVKGNEQMGQMLAAMADIDESSNSINKIIKVIDDIAFQTNILALNAAVEAARAGQHGKGFAVVAEEVRVLAAKSANAAKETTELIESSIRKVAAGTKIASSTAAALDEIVEKVKQAADLVEDIAVASEEQSAAVEQVNQGIFQVSNVVQSNAATSEESAAAAEELSSQALQLKELVGTFKVQKKAFDTDKIAAAGAGLQRRTDNKPAIPAKTRPVIALSDSDYGKY